MIEIMSRGRIAAEELRGEVGQKMTDQHYGFQPSLLIAEPTEQERVAEEIIDLLEQMEKTEPQPELELLIWQILG